MTTICLTCRREQTDPVGPTCPEDGQPLYPVLLEFTGDADRLVGRILDGRYRVEVLLGAGGMGLVVRAQHVFLERTVAIKLLHPELLLMPEVKARFKREARAASAVAHENVVDITDFGVTRTGIHYLVMEFLGGTDLHGYIDGRDDVSVELVVRIGIEICRALSALHEAGFVHRDLKPENVQLLSDDAAAPRVKLLDFGVAGLLTPDPDSGERLTGVGRTIGTPSYMSPEQALARPLDLRTDLYALGCVLWECLTGRVLFGGNSALEIMKKHLAEPPPPVSSVRDDIPAWLDAVLARALAKDPADRYPNAEAMAEALTAGLDMADAPLPFGEPFGPDTQLPVGLQATAEARAATASWERLPSGVAAAITLETGEVEALKPRRRWLWPAALLVACLLIGGALIAKLSGEADPPAASTLADAPASAAAPPTTETTLKSEPAPPVEVVEPVAPSADAAAQPEAGAAPELPAVAESVVLSFRVAPEGAEVIRAGEVLGRTPLSLVVDRADVSVHYEVRAEGRQTLALDISHDSARTIDGALSPIPKPPTTKPRRDPTARKRAPEPAAPVAPSKPSGSELMRPAAPPSGDSP